MPGFGLSPVAELDAWFSLWAAIPVSVFMWAFGLGPGLYEKPVRSEKAWVPQSCSVLEAS